MGSVSAVTTLGLETFQVSALNWLVRGSKNGNGLQDHQNKQR